MAANEGPIRTKTSLSFNLRKLRGKLWRLFRQPRVLREDRIIVLDESDRCKNPVFLTGLHRSGTTLVRQIVDSHSRIACPAETFFLTGMAETFENAYYVRGIESMGFDRPGVAHGFNLAISHFFETYRRSKGKPRWADKTPQYVLILPFIEEIFGPACQYLMIYRHPFDVINSLLGSGWDFSLPHWSFMRYHEDHFTNLAMYVSDGLQRQIDFQAEHADRCHSIHYEQLVTDAENVLRSAFSFLGEPWESEVLAFHKKPHDHGTGDPDARGKKGFQPSVGNFKGWSNDQIKRATGILANQLDQLGYDAGD